MAQTRTRTAGGTGVGLAVARRGVCLALEAAKVAIIGEDRVDRGNPGRRQFGDGHRTGAAHHQIGPRVAACHVVDEGRGLLCGQVGRLARADLVLEPGLRRDTAGRDAVPTPLMVDYYRQRASAGLIISEATGISREGLGWPAAPGVWSEEQVEGWSLDALQARWEAL